MTCHHNVAAGVGAHAHCRKCGYAVRSAHVHSMAQQQRMQGFGSLAFCALATASARVLLTRAEVATRVPMQALQCTSPRRHVAARRPLRSSPQAQLEARVLCLRDDRSAMQATMAGQNIFSLQHRCATLAESSALSMPPTAALQHPMSVQASKRLHCTSSSHLQSQNRAQTANQHQCSNLGVLVPHQQACPIMLVLSWCQQGFEVLHALL